MLGEAISSAENSGKPWEGQDPTLNPTAELTALNQILAGGEGVAAPLQEPNLRSRPSVLVPNEKSWKNPCQNVKTSWILLQEMIAWQW